MKKIFAPFLFCLNLTSCATGVRLDDLNNSIPHIRTGLQQIMPGGINGISQNQRTFVSKYFPPGEPLTKSSYKLDAAAEAPVRALLKVVILGDRRPYTVEMEVTVEARRSQGASYRVVGKDSRLARTFAKELREYLVKSQDDRDLIDAFRPF